VDPNDIAQRTRSYTSSDKIHSHVAGVKLGGHSGTVNDINNAKRELDVSHVSNASSSHWLHEHKVSPRNKMNSSVIRSRSMSPKRSKEKEKKKDGRDSPIRWFMTNDPKSGLDYWYNPWSGETTWHKPKDFDSSRGAFYNHL